MLSIIKWLGRGCIGAICLVSPILASRILYRVVMGKRLNLRHPRTLNEKLMWLKLNTYYKNPLVTSCADKFQVREYVASVGLTAILPELYGVWEAVDEIEWASLPPTWVLKCNHGCGFNILQPHSDLPDWRTVQKRLHKWMKTAYWRKLAETNYRYIPRRIICEEYLSDENGRVPDDYKFYCFNGKAAYVLVCAGRINGQIKYYFFDRSWQLARLNPDSLEASTAFTLPKPPELEHMFIYAERLAKPFPFVRVDLYALGKRIVFGEMTFTPSACMDRQRLPETDLLFGQMLKITDGNSIV